ncbi:MAG: hypothetical protein NT013_24015 [Planctomycetia bacterium]|nr:hypothetical protein [Planctomycetia bacterium]
MRKIIVVLGVVAGGLVSVFAVAGRGTHELKGFVQASADRAADGVTESLPEEIHDRKIDQEMKQVRLDLIDRQVQMNLSSRKIEELTAEVTKLTGSTERRQRLLAEAYPILKAAIDSQQTSLKWANQEFALPAFQKEIDDLLAMQDREAHQLNIKREGLTRLKKSVDEGELALTEMRRGLEDTEQKVALLQTRREQAEVESQTLDLVNAATTNQDTVAASLNKSVDRLKDNVGKTEARNEARRGTASVAERTGSNQVARSFNRLESLKAIHDATAKPVAPAAEPVPATKSETQTIEASKVVIEIQKKAE